MISAIVALVVLVLAGIATISALGWRRRPGHPSNLGSVSPQWLLVHKGDDR